MSKIANAKDKHNNDLEFQALKETIGIAQRRSGRSLSMTMGPRRRSFSRGTTEFKRIYNTYDQRNRQPTYFPSK